jgi:hypothetical protein
MQDNRCAGHCWVWAMKTMDWVTDEGKVFKGNYVIQRCNHCHKMGQVLCKYRPEEHQKLIQGSQEGFARVHSRRPCPSVGRMVKKKVKEYQDDF